MGRSLVQIFSYIIVLYFVCSILISFYNIGYHESFEEVGVRTLKKHLNHPSSRPAILQSHFNDSFKSNFDKVYHRIYPVNCSAVFSGNETHLNDVIAMLRKERYTRKVPSDEVVGTSWLQSCDEFKMTRGYPTSPFSKEEAEFPIAYAIAVHKYSAQVERLLRSIYQPQNVYCFHIDRKSYAGFHSAIRNLTGCFDNVFVASKLQSVYWADISVVQADLNCMNDLLKYTATKWKYFINLSGQEFPLKTNLEIVRQLKAYNGHNCIEGGPISGNRVLERITNRGVKGPPPCPIDKGSRYIAATTRFVDFVLNSNISKTLLNWLKETLIPDEMFVQSLNRLPQAPGGIPRKGNVDDVDIECNMRYVKWHSGKNTMDKWVWKPKCHGWYVREVCIFNSKDLQYLWQRPELFVNKFWYTFDPVTMQCLEELLDYRTRHPEELQNEVNYFPVRNFSWQTEANNIDHPP